MAIINIANDSQFGTQIDTALTEATTFRLAAGIYADRIWPRNHTNFPLTIEPQDRSNPPTIRGWVIGGGGLSGNFDHLSGPQSSAQQDITFDGLRFEAQRFTSAIPDPELRDTMGSSPVSIVMPDGQGLGWRISGTSHPAGGANSPYSEAGGMSGLIIGTGCENITVKNCIINGYANAIRVRNSTDTVNITHNLFEENCEDLVKVGGGGNGLTIEWNTIRNLRGATSQIAQIQGWGREEPPHADWVQLIGAVSNLIIRNNYMDDRSTRLHGGLIGNQAAWGINQTVLLENNEHRQTHQTGFLVNNCNNLTVRRNKISSYLPLVNVGPVLQVSPTNNTNRSYHDNHCTRIQGGGTNNLATNNENIYPSGWVHIRQSLVDPGEEYTGPYGDTGGGEPEPPAQPVPLETGDAYFHDWVVDPDIDESDPRRCAVFEIDPAGPAHEANQIRWAFSTDTPPLARATIQIAGTGPNGGNLYRASSGGSEHLVLPGDTKTFYLYYHETSDGLRSERSNVSFTETVPIEVTDPELLQTIDFSLYSSFFVNDEEIERLVCEDIVRWTKAGGEQGDSTGYIFNTLEVVDTLPAGNIQPPGVLYGVKLNVEASPKTRVWISADGARDPDDNVALMVGVANALKIISEDSDYELAGVLTGDTLDGAQYRMVDPDGTLPGWITPNSLFNNIENNRRGAGNLAFFRKWAAPAFESLQIPTYDPIAEEVDAGDPWDFNATTLGEISEASQALVADILAAMATTGDRVVYSAGGGANVPAEAIGYLLSQGHTKVDILPHFAVIQHGRNNWARQYEPQAKTRTVELTIAVTQQAQDSYANGWVGPGLSTTIVNPATADASIYGVDFNDALQVAIGEMGYGSGLPAYATFASTTSGSDCGSHVFAFDREALEAAWNQRMITGDNLDEGSTYLINAASGPDRLRVLYNSFTPSDVTTLFNGTGSGTLIAYLNSLLS